MPLLRHRCAIASKPSRGQACTGCPHWAKPNCGESYYGYSVPPPTLRRVCELTKRTAAQSLPPSPEPAIDDTALTVI
ncbi:hypothetical protein PLICRDRAFT_44536 [Plicaturopsis crispa FD-325 SS-3]|nr:hypothetical protein PLICRDRAFT_44536 [Plicaturopsis crispa FD-325 SS-3]